MKLTLASLIYGYCQSITFLINSHDASTLWITVSYVYKLVPLAGYLQLFLGIKSMLTIDSYM